MLACCLALCLLWIQLSCNCMDSAVVDLGGLDGIHKPFSCGSVYHVACQNFSINF